MSIKNVKPIKQTKKGRPKQGYFHPTKPEKYLGDANKIIYRSGWERKFCIYCDTNDNIVEWSSEPFTITYFNKLDQKKHKYYPDFFVRVKKGDKIDDLVIEVKPKKYAQKPKMPKRKTKKKMKEYSYRAKNFVQNACKWDATKKACLDKGYKFEIITEDFFKKI